MTEKETENITNSKKHPSDNRNALFKSFRESLEKKDIPEDQLHLAISFMKESILETKNLRFKDFWSAQKICLTLFKEKMGQTQRKQLWSEYIELLKEARCLKELVEEEATFSFNQIDLAVKALEQEVENLDIQLGSIDKKLFSPPKHAYTQKKNAYRQWSAQLVTLKSAASRLVSLRKELLGLSLQAVKRRNLLNRLDQLGDVIFPIRKKLIEKVSATFIKDVEDFVTSRCIDQGKESIPYYILQKEIKSFQAFARMLHLNQSDFKRTRDLLSKAWDSLKEKEVEDKHKQKEINQQQKENFETISNKVLAFKDFCQEPVNLIKDKVIYKKEALLDEARSMVLQKEAFSQLVADIKKIEQEAFSKIKEKLLQKKMIEEKRVKQLKESLSKLMEEKSRYSFEELERHQEACISEYTLYDLSPFDRLMLEHQLLDLKTAILDKKGEKLALKEEIEVLYGERLDLKEEIKNKIEIYRKQIGMSALDIEKAFIYSELYESAKTHLCKVSAALQNLEEKFSNLES